MPDSKKAIFMPMNQEMYAFRDKIIKKKKYAQMRSIFKSTREDYTLLPTHPAALYTTIDMHTYETR